MVRQLAPDAPRALIAAGATALIVLTGNAWMQLLAIAAVGFALLAGARTSALWIVPWCVVASVVGALLAQARDQSHTGGNVRFWPRIHMIDATHG